MSDRPTQAPTAHSAETAALLSEVGTFIRRFVVLSDAQVTVLALFVMETHIFDHFDCAPYVHITSAEKQCGKTRLLEVLELLVARPWLTGKVSAAALVRKIERDHPTLLLDETDAAFGGDRAYSETLRGVLNLGHRRGVKASLCIVSGKDVQIGEFDVFGPKVIAGIGRLPDTVADRSIPIHLKRKRPEESAERFRRRLVEVEAAPLRERLAAWAQMSETASLSGTVLQLPETLSDRQEDIAEPLIAVSEMAEGDWARAGKLALLKLFGGSAAVDESIGVRLLTDIRQIFEEARVDRIASRDLVFRLSAMEGAPWEDFNHGKALNPSGLARIMRGFDIEPHNLRIGTDVVKGYLLADFEDAWARYLRPAIRRQGTEDATPLQPALALHKAAVAKPRHCQPVADQESAAEPREI